MTQVKERPILFSGPMVRAILEGRKTQTRRTIKFTEFGESDTPGYRWHFRGTRRGGTGGLWQDMRQEQVLDLCPYGKPGDRLRISEEVTVKPMCEDWYTIFCHADRSLVERPCDVGLMQKIKNYKTGHLRGVHLPPAYARTERLEIVIIRVERLHEISEADAIAEGVERIELGPSEINGLAVHPMTSTYVAAFERLWEAINGPGSWSANPWVWVVEFRMVEP